MLAGMVLTKQLRLAGSHFWQPLAVANEVGLCHIPPSGEEGSSVQSLRGSLSPRYELVAQLGQHMRFDHRTKRSNFGSGDVNDPPSLVGTGSRLNAEPLRQNC